MNCPKCGKELKVIPNGPDHSALGCEDIEFQCPDEHLFFIRVKPEDLIDQND